VLANVDRCCVVIGDRWDRFEPSIQPFNRVAVLFPEARLDLIGRAGIPREPFERLVAEHRGDVQANGPAVFVVDRRTQHRVRNDHVGKARLIERQAFGVCPVVGVERERDGAILHPGAVEEVRRGGRPPNGTSGTRQPVNCMWKSLNSEVFGIAFKSLRVSSIGVSTRPVTFSR